jgi:hypothetical protein
MWDYAALFERRLALGTDGPGGIRFAAFADKEIDGEPADDAKDQQYQHGLDNRKAAFWFHWTRSLA